MKINIYQIVSYWLEAYSRILWTINGKKIFYTLTLHFNIFILYFHCKLSQYCPCADTYYTEIIFIQHNCVDIMNMDLSCIAWYLTMPYIWICLVRLFVHVYYSIILFVLLLLWISHILLGFWTSNMRFYHSPTFLLLLSDHPAVCLKVWFSKFNPQTLSSNDFSLIKHGL